MESIQLSIPVEVNDFSDGAVSLTPEIELKIRAAIATLLTERPIQVDLNTSTKLTDGLFEAIGRITVSKGTPHETKIEC